MKTPDTMFRTAFAALITIACAITAAGADQRDPIVGKWTVAPAVGTGSRTCTITFSAGMNGRSGRANPFACHQVEGLGGLHGFADVSKWERKGDRIILSGIAQPSMGSIQLPLSAGRARTGGALNDGIRFTLSPN